MLWYIFVSLCENCFHSLSLLPQEYTLKFSMWRVILNIGLISLGSCACVFIVKSLSCVWLFVAWIAACQAFLSFTISQSLLKLMSIELAEPSKHLILSCPLLLLPSIFSSIRVFSNESVFTSGGWSIGASALASVFPINIQGWFPLGLTGLNSLLHKGLSRIFSSTTVQKHQFFGAQPSLVSNYHICTWLPAKP